MDKEKTPKETCGFLFDEPKCLIYTDDQGKMAINKDILDKIAEVSKQLNVVAIAGLYRTGKSYLLTRLAGRYKGFPLGSTIQSKTKGIWAWCLDHPTHKKQKLLLLDTEGLGDIMKGDINHDNNLFALVTLLSSTLVYNTMGAFDQDALNKLHFITEMSKYILTSNNQDLVGTSTDHEFDLYFPEFILTLRDFTLELKIDDKDITSDEYLEYCLKLMTGDQDTTKEFNKPRYCMRKYFKQRKCFVFEQPAIRKQLRLLEELDDGQLDEDFVKSVMQFTDYVHYQCKPFTLLGGSPVTGRMFASLVQTYVTAIRDGAIPCIQSALESMAQQENETAVNDAVSCYKKGMDDTLSLPTEDEHTVLTAHITYKASAFDIFRTGSIMDNDNVYKVKMDKRVLEEYEAIYLRNEALSQERCADAMKHLRSDIDTKIKDGSYSKAGGSKIYGEDRAILNKKYSDWNNLGVKRESSFVMFCRDWETEESAIYNSDIALTEQERLAEVERLKNEKMRKEEELYRKESENAKLQMEKNYEQLQAEMQILNKRHENEIALQKQKLNEIEKKRQADLDQLQKEHAEALQQINKKYDEDVKQHANDIAMLNIKLNERDANLKQETKKMEEYAAQAKAENRRNEQRIDKMDEDHKQQLEKERELRRDIEAQKANAGNSSGFLGGLLEAIVTVNPVKFVGKLFGLC